MQRERTPLEGNAGAEEDVISSGGNLVEWLGQRMYIALLLLYVQHAYCATSSLR